MASIEYLEGSAELIDQVAPLWERLKQHHAQFSQHFPESIKKTTFAQRKQRWQKEAAEGQLQVLLAYQSQKLIGYCVSGINQNVGEVHSIFVDPDTRGEHVGTQLMNQALHWMDQNQVKSKKVEVATGNEAAYPFYERFDFFPRTTILLQKSRDETS